MSDNAHLTDLFHAEENIPAEHRLDKPILQNDYLLDGKMVTWNGDSQEVISPLLLKKGQEELAGPVIGCYPLLKKEQALEALGAATRAYNQGRGHWPTLSVEERIKHVESFVIEMKKRRSEVVRLLMWEIAKSYQDSLKEFDRTVQYIVDTIEAMKELDRRSSRFEIDSGIIGQIRRAPLGVTLCMGPSNYPLNETYTILIPALLMGNTVVFKPPRVGVLLHRPLLDAFCQCFPAGVVNTVYGDGQEVIGPLLQSGGIDCLAFIGSSRVADILRRQHPKPHRLRCILGLEAKNPAIILPDADIKNAVYECLSGSLSFNGQRCTALKIIFVHNSITQSFLDSLCKEIEQLAIGMPWQEDVVITPLEPDRVAYFSELIEDALSQGASVLNAKGGEVAGTFFYPALVYPVKPGMRLYSEEQFGPIVAVTSFEDIEEPIKYMINSNYGQQVSIFGKDPEQLAQLIDPLVNQVCRVNINSQCQRGPDTFPFTGRKDSAEGTLSVSDALRVFSIRTLVAAKGNEQNKEIINSIVRERMSKFLSDDFLL